jgi:serine/threonine protein kinase/Flp pilus assembly protein TadD
MKAPVSVPTREAGPDGAEQNQLTIPVPIFYPPPTASAPIDTPPPSSQRRLDRSVVAGKNAEESGVGLRVGDTFLGFQLVEELGQGAFARVFLARQESLAGRPVALKVTLRPTREAERLARLQHTNVVPVYSVHNAPPVQVICMPYLGRRTVADVVRAYRDDHPSREQGGRRTSGTRAARTTDVVDSASGPKSSPSLPVVRPSLVGAEDAAGMIGDPIAVLRVLSQLAAGLAHAHERGILHLDLKPANVLLPDTGEPMLLDFNLSFDTTTADRELVGGTVPYMATEQLLDLRTRGRGQIDARTDLYSLGVMAFEMLTGTVPFPASSKDLIDMDGLIAQRRAGPPSLRELNPAATPAVEAIIRKLLAAEPKDRYQSAADLKTDIDRHLADRPLLFAREASLRERLGKWRRRNPRVAGRLTAAALFGLVVGLGAIAYQKHEAASTSEAITRGKAARLGLDTTRLDLIVANDPRGRARGIARAEEVLASYGLPGDASWMNRPEVRRLPEPDRAALAADLGELMLLLAQARYREAELKGEPGLGEAAAQALQLNRAARTCFPADAQPPLIDRQAAEIAFAAGVEAVSRAEVTRERSPRELFLDAAAAMGKFKYAEALPLLERVVKDSPQHAAAQFCVGYCKERLGKHESALERFEVVQPMLPGDPRPAYHRGVILGTLRRPVEAEKEFTKVIELDPEHALAHRNRGFARFRLGQELKKGPAARTATATLKGAEADLSKALALGAPAIQILNYRQQVRRALGDVIGADADRERCATLRPESEADFIARGNARLEDADPEGALDDYREAMRINPRSLNALENQILALDERLARPEDALAVADRLTGLSPDYAAGRVNRGVLLAKLGRRDEAHAEAERALALAAHPEVMFAAARVFALTSKDRPGDAPRAFELLGGAIKSGFGRPSAILTSPDLEPIRGNERYRKLADAITSLYQ